MTKYLIRNGSKAEGVLLKLNNLLNSNSPNLIVGHNDKILEQLVGNTSFCGICLYQLSEESCIWLASLLFTDRSGPSCSFHRNIF